MRFTVLILILLMPLYGALAMDVPATPLPLPRIPAASAIFVCPQNPERIIAAIGRDVWRSEDGGLSWETFSKVLSEQMVPRNQGAPSFYLSADVSGTVLCIGAREQWAVSRDGGRIWREIPLADIGLIDRPYRPLHLVVDAQGQLYATGQTATESEPTHLVRRCAAAGDPWTTLRTGKPGEDFTLFRSSERLGILTMHESRVRSASMDGGQSWTAWSVHSSLAPNGNGFREGPQVRRLLIGHRSAESVWITGTILGSMRISALGALEGALTLFPPSWNGVYDRIRSAIPHPERPNELYAEHLGHLARSSDGGRTWGVVLMPSSPLAEHGVHGWIRRAGSWFLLASTSRQLIACAVTDIPADVSVPFVTLITGSLPTGPITAVRHCHPLWMCQQEDGHTLLGDGVHLWRRPDPAAVAQRLDVSVWPPTALLRYPSLMPQVVDSSWHLEAWSDTSPGLLSTDGGRTLTTIAPPRPAPISGWWRAGLFNRTHLACVFIPYADAIYSSHLSRDAGRSWVSLRCPRLRNDGNEPRSALFTKATGTVLNQYGIDQSFTTRDGRSWRSTGNQREFRSHSLAERLPDGSYLDTSEEGGRRILPRENTTVLWDTIPQTNANRHWLIPNFPATTAISQRGWTVVVTSNQGRTWQQRDPPVTSMLPCRVMRDAQGEPLLVTVTPEGSILETSITPAFLAEFGIAVP